MRSPAKSLPPAIPMAVDLLLMRLYIRFFLSAEETTIGQFGQVVRGNALGAISASGFAQLAVVCPNAVCEVALSAFELCCGLLAPIPKGVDSRLDFAVFDAMGVSVGIGLVLSGREALIVLLEMLAYPFIASGKKLLPM